MSKIEWTGKTWNPVVGCTICGPACANCYAMGEAYRKQFHPNEKIAEKYANTVAKTKAGQFIWTGKLNFSEEALLTPLKRKTPTTWFVNSMSDLFHEDMPEEWIDRIFAVMAMCPQHTFQILTKRPERMRAYFEEMTEIRPPRNGSSEFPRAQGWVEKWASLAAMRANMALPWREPPIGTGRWYGFCADMPWPLRNVWLGVSIWDQASADESVPALLATPAAVRFLSCEPMLAPIDLTRIAGPIGIGLHSYDVLRGENIHHDDGDAVTREIGNVDWVIVGGESGRNARSMHPEWARSLRDDCAAAGIPFFFKQWGEWAPSTPEQAGLNPHSGWQMLRGHPGVARAEELYPETGAAFVERVGKKRAGRLLDGVEHNGVPS